MLDELTKGNDDPIDSGLAKTFRRVGRVGFWVQIVIGAVPILVAGSVLLINRTIVPGGRFSLIGFFAVGSLLILVFTTLWFVRYARLATRVEQGGEKWTRRRLTRIVAIGLAASSVGILFSTIVMVVEVAYLLVVFLQAPQGGLPVIQTTGGDASWISAIDILSLMAMMLVVAAEIIVLVLGLWLLYRVATAASERVEAPQPLPAT